MNAPARILVIDDDPSILFVVTEALAAEGYHTIGAHNGKEALAHLGESLPDVVIVDLMMPVMDGPAFARALQQRPGGKEIPLLVLSATYDGPRKAARLGAAAFIGKPFDLDELIDCVARLARARARTGSLAILPIPAVAS